MHDQAVLDLLGVYVHAPRDDHERLAVGEEEPAVLVEVAHVAEGGPAVAARVLGALGLVRGVVVLVGRAATEVDGAGLAWRWTVALHVAVVDLERKRAW